MVDPSSPLRRNRDFLLLWTGGATSLVGTRVAAVAYPLLALSLTRSPASAGVLVFVGRLPWFLFTLPAGVLGDRVNRKRVMLVWDAVAAAAMVSVAAALALSNLTLGHLFVAAFLEGTAFIFIHVAEPGALKQIVPPDQVPDAVAGSAARDSTASLVGPPLGGFLLEASRVFPFLVNAGSYLVSFGALLFTRTPFQEPNRRDERTRMLRDIREGIMWLWAHPFLRASLLLVGVGNFFTSGLTFILIIVVKQQTGSSGLVGIMLALLALGGLVGSIAAPRLRQVVGGRLIVVGYNWVAAVITLPLVGFMPDAVALGAVFAVLMFFGPLWNAVVDGYRISIVPDRLQGRITSVDALFAFGPVPLGPLVAGVLLESVGSTSSVFTFGAIMLVVAVIGSTSPALREGPPSRAAAGLRTPPASW
jgi:MFS family permease